MIIFIYHSNAHNVTNHAENVLRTQHWLLWGRHSKATSIICLREWRFAEWNLSLLLGMSLLRLRIQTRPDALVSLKLAADQSTFPSILGLNGFQWHHSIDWRQCSYNDQRRVQLSIIIQWCQHTVNSVELEPHQFSLQNWDYLTFLARRICNNVAHCYDVIRRRIIQDESSCIGLHS